MRARCGQHGIALGDDGTCVLCRRTTEPAAAPLHAASTDASAPRGIRVALGAALLVAGAVAATAMVAAPRSPNPVVVAAEPRPRVAEPPGAAAEAASIPAPVVVPPSQWVSEPMSEGPAEPSDIAQSRAVAGQQVARARALERQQAEYEAWAHREAVRDIEEDEARARRRRAESEPASVAARGTGSPIAAEALQRVRITMYSASWCKACAAARTFLGGAGIPFTERDVDTDLLAASEARRLNPRGSIPTFDIAGTTIVGFRPKQLVAAIQRAAAR